MAWNSLTSLFRVFMWQIDNMVGERRVGIAERESGREGGYGSEGHKRGKFPVEGQRQTTNRGMNSVMQGVRTRYEQLAICNEASGSFLHLRIEDAQLEFSVD